MTTATEPAPPAQTGRSLRDEVLDAIPGRAELAAALAATRRLPIAQPVDRFAERSALFAGAAESLIATGRLPEDLDSRLADVDARVAASFAGAEIITSVRTIVKGRLDEVEHRGAGGPALEALNGELGRLLDQVRDLQPALTGIGDTDSAARAGGPAAEAWRQLLDLVDRHQMLRNLQLSLVAEALGGAPHSQRAQQLIERVGLVRDSAELDPARARREKNEIRNASWPEPTDGPSFLLWCAGPEGRAWVPTVSRLEPRTPT